MKLEPILSWETPVKQSVKLLGSTGRLALEDEKSGPREYKAVPHQSVWDSPENWQLREERDSILEASPA